MGNKGDSQLTDTNKLEEISDYPPEPISVNIHDIERISNQLAVEDPKVQRYESNLPNLKPTNRELPRFSSATTIGSLSTNTSFQTCADYGDDSYDGDSSNIDAHDVLQNVIVPSDIDSL